MRRRTLLLIASIVAAAGLAIAAPSAFAGSADTFETNSKCCATP
ncbi:hypothetical protein [Alloactinosynnema sp. L-07]|nr:hypothetical protein [Alloactinosynnema sp. L-07]CRK55593.1 hypothetical protein [Alloactinosynnema sp. L-07]